MNCCIFTGRVVTDPRAREIPSGKMVYLTMAVRRPYRNKENDYDSDFPMIKAFSNKADIIEQYIKKGDVITVRCMLQTDKYEKDGQTVYTNDFIVDDFDLPARPRDDSEGDADGGRNSRSSSRRQRSNKTSKSSRRKPQPSQDFDEFDESEGF